MRCCTRPRYEALFNQKRAAKDLERYRKDGPDPTTRALLDALRSAGVDGAAVLDIGAGVGVVHHELLDAGARAATHVDASAPYIEAAKREVERRGHADRVTLVHGDFVAVASNLESADVVTLDRVICCYGDMESLVRESASRARTLYGAVYPREWWFLKVWFAVINYFMQLVRGFRFYIHSTEAIDVAIRRQGLQPRTQLRTFIWHVVVYARPT